MFPFFVCKNRKDRSERRKTEGRPIGGEGKVMELTRIKGISEKREKEFAKLGVILNGSLEEVYRLCLQ